MLGRRGIAPDSASQPPRLEYEVSGPIGRWREQNFAPLIPSCRGPEAARVLPPRRLGPHGMAWSTAKRALLVEREKSGNVN